MVLRGDGSPFVLVPLYLSYSVQLSPVLRPGTQLPDDITAHVGFLCVIDADKCRRASAHWKTEVLPVLKGKPQWRHLDNLGALRATMSTYLTGPSKWAIAPDIYETSPKYVMIAVHRYRECPIKAARVLTVLCCWDDTRKIPSRNELIGSSQMITAPNVFPLYQNNWVGRGSWCTGVAAWIKVDDKLWIFPVPLIFSSSWPIPYSKR